MRTKNSPQITPRRGLTRGQTLFLLMLLGSGMLLCTATAFRDTLAKWWQPNLEAEARKFLRENNVQPLSDDLQKLLAAPPESLVATQPHPLLNQPAPDFTLRDHQGVQHSLAEKLKSGPVVLVFYYGYYCNHCVGQLFALHDDIARFRELGADVLAVSADPPEETRERFQQYGEFRFPVLSDPGNRVAQTFSVFAPAKGERAEELQHGTFVIDRQGIVRWSNFGDQPFTKNQTLLVEIAKLTPERLVGESDVGGDGPNAAGFLWRSAI